MPPVRLERDGDVAEIVLAAPPLNLFDDALFAGLVEAVAAVEADLPRALIVRAEGKVFTGGVDVHVLDSGDLLASARRFAAGLAAGPTRAHAATKAVVKAQSDHGVAGADARIPDLTSHLFDTHDARKAIATFLEVGPGKATFTGK
jgi:enoyl-CoA hydratase/carnithine racemase